MYLPYRYAPQQQHAIFHIVLWNDSAVYGIVYVGIVGRMAVHPLKDFAKIPFTEVVELLRADVNQGIATEQYKILFQQFGPNKLELEEKVRNVIALIHNMLNSLTL